MEFDRGYLGPQGRCADDDAYVGSRYSDIKRELFHNAYYLNWGEQGEPELPVYGVTLGRVLRGLFRRSLAWQFKAAAERTVDSRADLRWGADRRGFRRLLHPNGVCLLGRWIIDTPSEYSGYFGDPSEALIVARYSTCCTETRRGRRRSLSLVGKLFPTKDPKHLDPLRTANFITQEDIGGDRTEYINDAELRNAPDVTPWRRGWGTPILLITGLLFKFVNVEPAIRQLHTIAELGKPDDQPTRAPEFMRLTVSDEQPRIAGKDLDFRAEILEQFYRREPLVDQDRKLVFHIDVTDQGVRRGLVAQKWEFDDWQRIGRIEFTEAVASYNSDFVIHFAHPSWRTDRNNPATQTRKPP